MGSIITRRVVLLGGAMVAAGGGCSVLAMLPAAAPTMRVLSLREVDIIEALARVQFPAGHFPVAGGDGGTAPMVDDIVADMLPPHAARGFRYMLRSLDLAALVARGVRFSRLPDDEAREVVDLWFSPDPAPRRWASESFKVVVGMGFLRRPEVLSAIGWSRGCIDGGPT
jgi:hypothetical protein